jgi:hypothetical protein
MNVYTLVSIYTQRAASTEGLVIGMGKDRHQDQLFGYNLILFHFLEHPFGV